MLMDVIYNGSPLHDRLELVENMPILVENAILAQSRPVPGFGGITLAGTLHHSPGCPGNPFRILGSYALVLILEGGGGYEDANGLRTEVQEGNLLLLFPELGHRYGPGRRQVWSEIYLVFEGPTFDCLRKAGILRIREAVSRPLFYMRDFEDLADIAAESGRGFEGQINACYRLQRWLLETFKIVPQELNSDMAMELVKGQLDLDLDRPMDPDALSRMTGLSIETIRKRFQAAFGISPVQYRLRRKVDVAKSLLLTTRLSNKEISLSLGFSDEFHFSKRFKAVTGMSPRAFRRATGNAD